MNNNRHTEARERVDLILDYYFSGERRFGLDDKIQAWLIDGAGGRQKEQALQRQWDRRVCETEPDSETFDSLAQIRSRLGFREQPAAVRRRSLTKVFFRVAAAAVLMLLAIGVGYFGLRDRETTVQPYAKTVRESVPVAPPAEEAAESTDSEAVTEILDTPDPVVVEAREAGRVHVTLPDGSQAWIHRNGSITYSEDFLNDRVVRLEGEAYFSVVKRDGQPFFVEAGDLSVKVLGTEFLVRQAGVASEARVEVISGAVEVTVGTETHLLEALDRLMFKARFGELSLDKIERKEAVAPWRDMDLNFENCTLNEVFQRISTFYDVNLVIDDRLPLNQRITVNFDDDEPLEEVLYVIRLTSGLTFDFERQANRVTLTKR